MKLASVLTFGCIVAVSLAAKTGNELHITLENVASDLTNDDLDVFESTMNQLVSVGGCIRREIQQIRQNLRSLAAGKTSTIQLVIKGFFTDCESGSRRQLKETAVGKQTKDSKRLDDGQPLVEVARKPDDGQPLVEVARTPDDGQPLVEVARTLDDGQPLVEVARKFGAEIFETRHGERLLLIPSGLCGNFPPPSFADEQLIQETSMVVTSQDLDIDNYAKVADKWLVTLQTSGVEAFAKLSALVVTE